MVKTRFTVKGREATFCEGVRSRVCGDMCLGISRRVTSYQSSNFRRHSIKAGATESSQELGYLLKRGSTNEEKKY